MIIYNLLSMGTCFSKSKCADVGRSLWKEACTTCLQMQSASPPAAPALSQSRALDFVWLCLWHSQFSFFAWLLSSCWPFASPGGEQDTPSLVLQPPTPWRSQLHMHCPHCSALRILSHYFCLFEKALRCQTYLPAGSSKYCK